MQIKSVTTILFILISFYGFSQSGKINKLDDQGRRVGPWKEYHNNGDKLRFEGTYDKGEKIGTFKYYSKKGKASSPKTIKEYSPNNDTVFVKNLNNNDELISEGKVFNEKHEGEWNYYFKSGLRGKMMTENYKSDELHGWKTVYYRDGQITSNRKYKNGLKDGKKSVYNESGDLMQEYTYSQDTLNGPSKIYNQDGEKLSEGNYKDGQREGEWKFYRNGEVKSVEKFSLN